MIRVVDDVLTDPHAYRAAALRKAFGDVTLGDQTFRGIAEAPGAELIAALATIAPDFTPTVSFLRRSPLGQIEPNYIHTDSMMGDMTAIFYLTPQPPPFDGTIFWRHRPTGTTTAPWTEALAADARDLSLWELNRHVGALFNRLLLFSADLFHSRAIPENYGQGDDSSARLIQVVFGTLPPKAP